MIEHVCGDVEIAVKQLSNADVDAFTDEELAEAMVWFSTQRNMFDAAEARFARAFDVRRVYAAEGAKSAAAWLTAKTRAPRPEVGGRLNVARACDNMPVAAGAWAA